MRLLAFFLVIFTLSQANEKMMFAYGKPINFETNSSLVKIALDDEVYEGVVHDDLSDIGIYDALGKAMPRVIKKERTSSYPTEKIELSFVKYATLRENLMKNVRLSYDGAQIELLKKAKTQNSDYIIDLTSMQRPLEYLYINTSEKDFMLTLGLECSDDLERWYVLRAKATIASLSYQNSSIIKNKIALPYRQCDYVRVTPEQEFSINSIYATAYQSKVPIQKKKKMIRPQNVEGGLYFEIPTSISATSLYFDLGNKQQLYTLELWGKERAEQVYKRISNFEIYNIGEDKKISQNSIGLYGKYRYYLLKAQKGSYLPSSSLYYEYQQDYLYFLPQGVGPYTFAYGSYDMKVENFSNSDLLLKNMKASQGELQQGYTLGGEEKRLPVKPDNTKTYWVFAALLLGVMILGFITFRLFKQMRSNNL